MYPCKFKKRHKEKKEKFAYEYYHWPNGKLKTWMELAVEAQDKTEMECNWKTKRWLMKVAKHREKLGLPG